jgi:hypothetical protein
VFRFTIFREEIIVIMEELRRKLSHDNRGECSAQRVASRVGGLGG